MPRQRSSRPAPRQTRSASTLAAPAPPMARSAPTHAPTATQTGTQSQPGIIGQMAATAGSVAIGSTIGHGLSNMLFGSSSARTEDANANQQLAAQNPSQFSQPQAVAGRCDVQAKDFTKCIEVADFNSCSYYLEQLKACQAAASQY